MIQHDVSFETKDIKKNMDNLFSMLDEAIDDMENGRVFSEEEIRTISQKNSFYRVIILFF